MKNKIALFAVVLSLFVSLWTYWQTSHNVEKTLTSREWNSTIISVLSPTIEQDLTKHVGMLSKVKITSNVKYLPNKKYNRVSMVELYDRNNTLTSKMSLSESGQWEISDNYLLINPIEFKDISTKDGLSQTMKIVEQFMIIDAQQSRKIDIVNDKAILLTSLSQGSRLLYSQ